MHFNQYICCFRPLNAVGVKKVEKGCEIDSQSQLIKETKHFLPG